MARIIEGVKGCGLPVGQHTSLAPLGHKIKIEEMQGALIEVCRKC